MRESWVAAAGRLATTASETLTGSLLANKGTGLRQHSQPPSRSLSPEHPELSHVPSEANHQDVRLSGACCGKMRETCIVLKTAKSRAGVLAGGDSRGHKLRSQRRQGPGGLRLRVWAGATAYARRVSMRKWRPSMSQFHSGFPTPSMRG